MIRALTPILVLLAAFFASPRPATAIEIAEITSPGGLTAWLVEDHSIPFAAVEILFRGGTSLDDPARRGAINLMTATLEEGAAGRDATEFAEAAEGLGARIAFSANRDALNVSLRWLSDQARPSAELARDALVAPDFAPEAVERVRAQVLAGLAAADADPSQLAQRALAARVWGDHPYGSDDSGTAESVAALTPDDLRAAKDRVLARDRVVIAAAGDITPEALGQLIDLMLGDLPAQASAPLPASATYLGTGGTELIDWDSPQTVLAFAQPGVALDDPDYFAAVLADHILGGGGFSSRLMDEIREKRGLSYGVSTALASGLYGDLWTGGMATTNDKAAEALDILRREWAGLAESITDNEVNAAKTYLTGAYPLRFDGNGDIASILAGMQLIGLPRDYPDTRNERVDAVTPEDVRRVAAQRLDAAALSVVAVGRPAGISAP